MARLDLAPPNFACYLTIGEAAEFLGVSSATLRNWDRSGKLKPRRHPQNGYRIYLHEDLQAVLKSADLAMLTDDSFAPQATSFDGVCHTRVIPAESYSGIHGEEGLGLLQQKEYSLQAEIEHRQEVQKSLLKREHELADFFENATEGLHKVGTDGTILWANKAAYSLLGYTAEEYIGHPVTEFHADEDVIADILQRLQRGESLINFPARLRCKNGAVKHVQINSNGCFKDGKFLYTRCFTRDVTQQWQAEKTLLETDRRKDEFLATLSHELRNPLAPIGNALELLNRDSDEAARTEATSIIRRQVGQLNRLVDDLLDISRITRDKIDLRKADVEIATIIHNAVETSRPTIDAANHQLRVTLPEQPVRLFADAARLAQVFSNLLNNAAKFTPAGGEIRVDARQEGRDVIISVRDNGVGISGEALAYVFDMFRQADQTLEKSQGGLGIGLTLVRRLVELHGGTVNAQSEGTGKGSEFTIRLPAAVPAPRTATRAAATDKLAGAKRRVLVVDDNKDSGDTLALLLKVKGHEVYTARDGFEAIEKTAELRPEIILMDVGMPKLNGYDATRRIRETDYGRDIYIVALTGWGQASDIARSLEAGCSAHMVKPVDFAALDQLLSDIPTSG